MAYIKSPRFSCSPSPSKGEKKAKTKPKVVKFAVRTSSKAYKGPSAPASNYAVGFGVASLGGCGQPNSFNPNGDGYPTINKDGMQPPPDKGQDPDAGGPPKLDKGSDQYVPQKDQTVPPKKDQYVPPKGDQYVPPKDIGVDKYQPKLDQSIPKDTGKPVDFGCIKTTGKYSATSFSGAITNRVVINTSGAVVLDKDSTALKSIYTGKTLPTSQGWTSTPASVPSGTVTLGTSGSINHVGIDNSKVTGTVAVYYTYPTKVDPIKGFIAKAKVKVLTQKQVGGVWEVNAGSKKVRVIFFTDKVFVSGSNQFHKMKTTDKFHSFELVAKGSDLEFYIDGTKSTQINGKGKFIDTNSSNSQNVLIGMPVAGWLGSAQYADVKLYSGGTTLPHNKKGDITLAVHDTKASICAVGTIKAKHTMPLNTQLAFKLCGSNKTKTDTVTGKKVLDTPITCSQSLKPGSSLPGSLKGFQYLQAKGDFSTTDTSITPSLSEFEAGYSTLFCSPTIK